MASNPLIPAVEHFSLAQLMADPNLCRNVLNDLGAQPAEVFLLVAALEARIPQTLIEHSATNDLSVVEPRLVAELNQRGVDLSRAEWAVNAWKEVIGGSTLGQPTVRPPEPATVRPTDPIVARTPEPPAVVDRPPPASIPPARRGGQRRKGLIVAAVIVALAVALVVALLTRPSSKHPVASSSTSGRSTTPSAGAKSPQGTKSSPNPSTSAATTANLAAPLGPPKTVSVAATVSWTDTGLTVTKGERINITATGQISPGPGFTCGPAGLPGSKYDIFSLIGGGQHHAALIGVIAGSNELFLVGANYNGVAPTAGRLYLGINDVGVSNNSGKYTAAVRLQQA